MEDPPDSNGRGKQGLNTIYWFRKALRLHDNPTLKKCLQGASSLHCVYFLDPWFASSQTSNANSDIHKWKFLLESLNDLDKSLRELNLRLYVVRGQPAEALPRLFRVWNIKRIAFEYDSEPYGKQRDIAIKRLAESSHIEVISNVSHTLYHPDEIINQNNGIVPTTYEKFQALVEQLSLPPHPIRKLTLEDIKSCRVLKSSKREEMYRIPTLEVLSFNTTQVKSTIWKGGESEALERLDCHVERRLKLSNSTKTSNSSLAADKSVLGPYLRFGCLSTRLLYHRLRDEYIRVNNHPPPISFHGQLIWREFLYTVSTNNASFDKMRQNPICLQIPWVSNPKSLRSLERGRTGFPWIDAIVTQLREEGWVHPIARQSLACYLTWGTLWINWEEGCKIFDDLLLDCDWTLSAGFWAWTSSKACMRKFGNVFCSVDFGKNVDPHGNYIRRYLPVLKSMPDKYLYEPWKAPLDLQRKIRCIIGTDYPKPTLDHREANRANSKKLLMLFPPNQTGQAGTGSQVRVPASKKLFKMPGPVKQRQPLQATMSENKNPRSLEEECTTTGRKRSYDRCNPIRITERLEVDSTKKRLTSLPTAIDFPNGPEEIKVDVEVKSPEPHSNNFPVLFYGSPPHYTLGNSYIGVRETPSQHKNLQIGHSFCSGPSTPKLYCAPSFQVAPSQHTQKFVDTYMTLLSLPVIPTVCMSHCSPIPCGEGDAIHQQGNFASRAFKYSTLIDISNKTF